jgi:hypothetical protein
MWWPGGKMTGTVQHEGRIYSIRHMGGEMHAVVEMGENLMLQEHASMPERLRANDPNLRDDPLVLQGDASALRPQATPSSNSKMAAIAPLAKQAAKAPMAGTSATDITIDVIVAYTRKAASNYSDVKRELVDLSIEEGNESFRQSGIGQVKLRLVHAYQTDYVEEGTHFDHVWRLADKGDGYMDEIHGLRDKYKPMSQCSSSTIPRGADWQRGYSPTRTKLSPSCITSARPPPTRSPTRSAIS